MRPLGARSLSHQRALNAAGSAHTSLNAVLLITAASIALFSAGAAQAAQGVTTNDLNVRKGQGTNYGVLAVIPGGSQVNVTGCSDGCHVQEYRGLASANFIDATRGAYAGYVPGNRLRYPQPERFFGPPAADYAFGPDWSTSYYVPGNRLRFARLKDGVDRVYEPAACTLLPVHHWTSDCRRRYAS